MPFREGIPVCQKESLVYMNIAMTYKPMLPTSLIRIRVAYIHQYRPLGIQRFAMRTIDGQAQIQASYPVLGQA